MDMYQKREMRKNKKMNEDTKSLSSTSINWYPGHMTKALRQMKEDIKLIDVVIELIDARIPYSSKNPDIDKLAENKKRVILLNKSDMADDRLTKQWKEHYESIGYAVAIINSKTGNGIKAINDLVLKVCAEKIAKDRAKGILNRPIRAMIVGIPNVGKSTFINSFAGKACAKTGNKPGVTKGKQWIRLNKNVELLDTPGVLWPKFEDQQVGLRIAWIGSINEDILNPYDLAVKLCEYLYQNYPGILNTKYEIEECESGEEMLLRIAVKRACLLKGGVPDTNRVAIFVMDDFKNGRIGKITAEKPEDRTNG